MKNTQTNLVSRIKCYQNNLLKINNTAMYWKYLVIIPKFRMTIKSCGISVLSWKKLPCTHWTCTGTMCWIQEGCLKFISEGVRYWRAVDENRKWETLLGLHTHAHFCHDSLSILLYVNSFRLGFFLTNPFLV